MLPAPGDRCFFWALSPIRMLRTASFPELVTTPSILSREIAPSTRIRNRPAPHIQSARRRDWDSVSTERSKVTPATPEIDLAWEQRKMHRGVAQHFSFCAVVLGAAFALGPRFIVMRKPQPPALRMELRALNCDVCSDIERE